MAKSNLKVPSTQKYLDIKEVKGDTIVLKDGGLRAILAVSSTNFALKSEEEQNAIIAGYQNFLNSLDFPIQILIRSRVLDLNGYLQKLRELSVLQTNELLRIQMNEYVEFVGRLVQFANIMSKVFYVVVPYSAAPERETFTGKLKKILNPIRQITASEESHEKSKVKLMERVDHVVSGLGGVGLRSIILKTEELVELLYEAYNFETASPLRAGELGEIQLNPETKGSSIL